MTASKPKVLLAMSGGVDSSVAAALLQRDGYDVVGVFMRLGTPGEDLDTPTPACDLESVEPHAPRSLPLKIQHQGCCSISDAADARLVAAELGIPLYICNFKKDFGRIIDYFTAEYARGRTPNPCVRCNDWLKFGKLHDYAKQLGATFVASGHYARLDRTDPNDCKLLQGVDETKDQSYVLFGAPRERLSEMLLPVGGYHKSEIRKLARQFDLPVFDKPDSQEICFVPDNNYASLVERMNENAAQAHAEGGDILDKSGAVVGRHAGQHRYTIGQRRGVGVATGSPIYVVDKDPTANTITVGDRDDTLVTSCSATETNFLVDKAAFAEFTPCLARYRYNAQPVPATARLTKNDSNKTARETQSAAQSDQSERCSLLEVRFETPQHAVAPGQAIVLYGSPEAHDNPDRVLGGGWITHAQHK